MDLYETNTLSFVIKIWIEEPVEQGGRKTWRGQLTHIPSQQRMTLRHIDDITTAIVVHLEETGIKMGLCWRARRLFMRWRRVLTLWGRALV